MKKGDPAELALALLNRSICHVQVAAVLTDNWGIHAWVGTQLGMAMEFILNSTV